MKKNSSAIKVVAADDDPIIRSLLHGKLVGMGCNAMMAEDGAEAWRLIRDKKADLAIVDLEMPNIDGFSLIQCVRGHPKTKHLPVIVVTSRTDAAAIQEAFAAGATSFLTKPVQWSTFESHIRYLMRLTEAAAQASSRARRAEAAMRIKDTALRRALGACRDGTTETRRILASVMEQLSEAGSFDALIHELDEASEICGQIELAMRHAEGMSHDLCARVNATDASVDLIALLANAQAGVAGLSQARDIPVSIVRAPENVFISCDADSLSSAVSSILDNAIRYSAEGTTVTIEADVHEDSMLTIAVTDQGPGMEPEFFAACLGSIDQDDEDADRNIENDGLGLPLVRAIMEAHGGALEIRSMPGEGTTAMLVIPADRVDSVEAHAA